nr:MbtH family protein [uncultured Cupriavidus sp.]
MSWDHPDTRFHVVRNHEGQYSIWPDFKTIPAGWESAGQQGTREECLGYIERVWTDMRPLSLQQALANP